MACSFYNESSKVDWPLKNPHQYLLTNFHSTNHQILLGNKYLPLLSPNFKLLLYIDVEWIHVKIHDTEHVLLRSADAHHSPAVIKTKTKQTKTQQQQFSQWKSNKIHKSLTKVCSILRYC